MKNGERNCALVRHVPEPLNPERAPKKYILGPNEDQIHVGSLVFYRNERYWVSMCPPSWETTHTVRICSKPFRPDSPEPRDAACFSVHADCVDLVKSAPKRNWMGRQPTVKSIQRAERARAGVRDVGDKIAELLRPLTLEQMFVAAANYLGEGLEGLKAKYAHLDNGRKRMVLGNRMRAKFKKEGV